MILPVDPSRYLIYLGVMVAMAFFPGPANLFSVAMGMSRGWKAALLGVVGMNLATLVWYAGAALGLGALEAAFPAVFRLLRIGGGLYLLWLAYGSVKDGLGDRAPAAATAAPKGRSALLDGFAVQIANPKILLFFTVVLPPFVDVRRPLIPQLILLGAATIFWDAAAMSAFGLGGAAFSRWMERPGFRRGFSLTTAGLLAAAAVLVALSALSG